MLEKVFILSSSTALCPTRSVLARLLRPLPLNTQPPPIGQLTHTWASTSNSNRAAVLHQLLRAKLAAEHKLSKRATRWRTVMSQSQGTKRSDCWRGVSGAVLTFFDLFYFGCLLYAQIQCKMQMEREKNLIRTYFFLTSCEASHLMEIWQKTRNKECFLQLSFRKSDLFALPVHSVFKMDSHCALWTTFAILALVQQVVLRLLTMGGVQ